LSAPALILNGFPLRLPELLTIRVTFPGKILLFCHCCWHNPARGRLAAPFVTGVGRYLAGCRRAIAGANYVCGLTVDRLFHRVRGSLNVLGVEMIEDFEVLFKTLAYVRCHDRAAQRPLRAIVRLGSWAPAPSAPPVMRPIAYSMIRPIRSPFIRPPPVRLQERAYAQALYRASPPPSSAPEKRARGRSRCGSAGLERFGSGF